MDIAIGGEGGGITALGVSTSTSLMTTLTDPGGTNSKGAWVALGTTTKESSEITILIRYTGVLSPSILIDIGIGPTGSETTIINNLLTGDTRASTTPNPSVLYSFPITLPGNTQLSMRYQTSVSSVVVSASIVLSHGGLNKPQPLSKVSTYGADTSTSGGTSVDAGATAHKMGAWTQLVASTSYPIFGFAIASKHASATSGTFNFFIELGIGASGSELTIFRHAIAKHQDSYRTTLCPLYGKAQVYPVNIPAGQRLSARMQSLSNTAGQRTQDVIVYAVS